MGNTSTNSGCSIAKLCWSWKLLGSPSAYHAMSVRKSQNNINSTKTWSGPFDSFFFSCFFGKCARAPLDQKTPENKSPSANCVRDLFNGMVAGICWLIHLQQCVFKAYTQAFDLQCIVWFLSVGRDGEKDPQKHFQLIIGAEKLLHGRSINMYMFVYAQNPSL